MSPRITRVDYCQFLLSSQINDTLTYFADHVETMKLFHLLLSTKRTDYVVTNDLAQDSAEAVQEACGFRWKIEEVHRGAKHVTGLEACQCRTERIQRNHIGCALFVWGRLNQIASRTGKTLYAIKHDLLDDYMRLQIHC